MEQKEPRDQAELSAWRATRYRDEREFRRKLRAVVAQIPPGLIEELRQAHEEHMLGCMAHSEGDFCCLADWFLDPDMDMTHFIGPPSNQEGSA